MNGFVSALIAGIIVTVGFDAVFHGLSHGGHGFLDRFWKDETSQRSSTTVLGNGITWHIISDVLTAIFLTILLVGLGAESIATWVGAGVAVGGITASAWMHVYAAFEISGKIVVLLGSLAVVQITLASTVIGWVYMST